MSTGKIPKSIKEEKSKKENEPIVLEFNLSKAILVLIIIGIIIGAITTVNVVKTLTGAMERKAKANNLQTITDNNNVNDSPTSADNGGVIDDGSIDAYVSSIQVRKITDGSAPFDLTNTAGNDKEGSNKIVRTFDKIEYDLDVSFLSRTGHSSFNTAKIGFEASIYKDLVEAEFSMSDMAWINADWKIEYLDNSGNIVATKTKDGMKDKNGRATSINSLVQDSTNYYNGNVVEQRLTGTMNLESKTQVVIPGTKSLSVYIKVNAGKNGDIVAPQFKAWVVGNEENIGAETNVSTNNIYKISSENEVTKGNIVTISAKPRYNAIIRPNTDMDYKSYFNLETGKGGNAGEANTILGRMLSYGITLQLYNETDNRSINLVDKGLKGIELPQGEISFDLTITETKNSSGEQIQQAEYIPILWDYYENEVVTTLTGDQKDKGHWNRTMYWNNEERSPYAKGAGPYNSLVYANNKSWSCYQGGTWSITEPKITSTENLIDSNRTYNVKISGYDFDFDNYIFPTHAAGNSGVADWVKNSPSFSVGQFQIIMQFPENVPETTSVNSYVKISNLKATSISDKKVEDTNNEQNGAESYYWDNINNLSVTFYKKGSMTKKSSFNSKDSISTNKEFLGTDFWSKSYDCSTYIGNQISLIGYVWLYPSTDNRIKAFNLLQKFDSKALEIDTSRECVYNTRDLPKEDIAGTATFLYAADPLYPDGYNSNNSEQMERMNTSEEEDYIYFSTLKELEDAGYTCVAVLIEGRNMSVMGGKYFYCRIPIKVKNNPELIGKTVCTVNTAKVWKDDGDMAGITWANGNYDENQKKNVLENYKTPEYYNKNDPSKGYVKTEYNNGVLVNGTHKGGHDYGMSLLLLGYKANVGIQSHNSYTNTTSSASNSLITFDMDKGQRTAKYIINNIIAKTDEATPKEGKANLKILAELDEKLTATPGGYSINNVLISDDKDNPTEITLSTGDNIKVYVERDLKGKKLIFYIKDAPIGVNIPDITFTAQIGEAGSVNDVRNNDRLSVTVKISGDGDSREYSTKNGNISTSTIGIILLNSTSIFKEVDKELAELNEDFKYKLTFSNTSDNIIHKAYIYDLLPNNGENSDSKFSGTLDVEKINLEEINNSEKSAEADTNIAEATIYYSTIEAEKLKPIIEKFGNDSDITGTSIDEILKYGYLGTDGQKYIDKTGALENNGEYRKLFKEFGILNSSNKELIKSVNASSETENITCIYGVFENIGIRKSLDINLYMNVNNNKCTDIYDNIFYYWIANTSKASYIASNSVYTSVISRRISGQVWEDINYNGIKEENENAISGVQATLFKYNETTKKYEVCTQDYLGNPINTIETDEKGRYKFETLGEGKYVVAFKGEVLDKYVITKYQINGENNENSSDGVKSSDLNLSGIEGYDYVIKYSNDVNDMKLHTTTEILDNNINLDNYQQSIKYQNIGLVEKKSFEFIKVAEEEHTNKLGGTEFKLYKLKCTKHEEQYHNDKTINLNIFNVIEAEDAECWELVDTQKSISETGKVVFENLNPHEEYRLVETKSTLGRIKADGQWKIEFILESYDETDTTIMKSNGVAIRPTAVGNPPAFIKGDNEILLPNRNLFQMPLTGSFGISNYYQLGIIILTMGVILLGIRKVVLIKRGHVDIRKQNTNRKNLRKGKHSY